MMSAPARSRFALPFFIALTLVCVLPSTGRTETREIDWLELMPAEDLALLENMPEIEHEESCDIYEEFLQHHPNGGKPTAGLVAVRLSDEQVRSKR